MKAYLISRLSLIASHLIYDIDFLRHISAKAAITKTTSSGMKNRTIKDIYAFQQNTRM